MSQESKPSWDIKLEDFIREMAHESNFKDFGFADKPCVDYADEGKFLSFNSEHIKELNSLVCKIREKNKMDDNISDLDIFKFIRKLIWLTYKIKNIKIKNICDKIHENCNYKNIKQYITKIFKLNHISKQLYDKYSVFQDCEIIIQEIKNNGDFKSLVKNHFSNIENERKKTIKYNIQPCFNINLGDDLQIAKIGDIFFIKKSILNNKILHRLKISLLEQDKQYIEKLQSNTIAIIKCNFWDDSDFKLGVIQSLIHIYLQISDSDSVKPSSRHDFCFNYGNIEQYHLYEIPLHYENIFFDMQLAQSHSNTCFNRSFGITGSGIYLDKERYKHLLNEKIVLKSKLIFSNQYSISKMLYWFSKARQADIKSEKFLNFCIALEVFSGSKDNKIERILKDLAEDKNIDFCNSKSKKEIEEYHKKYPSLTQQIIKKIKGLGINFDEALFRNIYGIRSKIVHTGKFIIEESDIKFLHKLVVYVSYRAVENL